MGTKHTRIKRSIEEFKNFLDYYYEEYNDAQKNIKPNQGWVIENYSDEIYELLNNLYGNLYESLYPKLTDDDPSTDEEILDAFRNIYQSLIDSQELFEKIIEKSEDNVLSIAEGIVYDLVSKAKYKLKEVITLAEDDLRNIRTSISSSNMQELKGDFLIGIVTATIEEHNAVLELLKDYTIAPFDILDSNTYYEGYFKKGDKIFKIVLTKTHHQGIPAATNTTTKLIIKYKPDILFMVGHLAGNKNLKKTQKLGHILIGEESVDYQQNEVIQKNIEEIIIEEKDRKRIININSWLKTQLELYIQKQKILDKIKNEYKDNSKFPDSLKAYVGKIVSGSALLRAADRYQEIISQNQGLIGLDMETHGFYYACQNTLTDKTPMFVSIKSISDFGEQGANYNNLIKPPVIRQKYACYTSVKFVYEFIMATF